MYHPDGVLGLISTLKFVNFKPPCHNPMPTENELETITKTHGVIAAATVVDDYLSKSANKYESCGIRVGCVLRLKSGGYIIVGHVSSNLGFVDDVPFVELEEIDAIAYLY